MQNLCGCPDILICRESAVGQIPSSRTTIHSFIIRFLQENVNGIFGKFAFLPILQEAFDGISANPAPFLCDVAIGQYRTKSVWRLCTPSACKFPLRVCFVSSCTHLACRKIRNRLSREICKQMACKVARRALCSVFLAFTQHTKTKTTADDIPEIPASRRKFDLVHT